MEPKVRAGSTCDTVRPGNNTAVPQTTIGPSDIARIIRRRNPAGAKPTIASGGVIDLDGSQSPSPTKYFNAGVSVEGTSVSTKSGSGVPVSLYNERLRNASSKANGRGQYQHFSEP